MKYNHITVQSGSEGKDPLDSGINEAVTQMQSQDFEASRETLRRLLSTVREQKWVGKEPQQVLATEDGRSIPTPPTPLLVKLLIEHPDLIPFIIDHYLISGGEDDTHGLMIAEQSRDRSEKIKAEKMERLLKDLGYSPRGLSDAEKQIALAHQYDSLKSQLLEALFVYPRQAISFDQSKKTRDNLGNLLGQ